MANDNPMSIFDLGIKDIDSYNEGKKETVLYKPTADEGKDSVYRSLIRFLPNPRNPRKSIIRKFVYWLKDSAGNFGLYDAPHTIGDKDPVQDKFFKLRNSTSAVDKKMSDDLKRREVYYSLVQIIKDPHNPELDGKVKIFKYGQKLKLKIDEELTPQFEEPTQVFDLFEGKNFELTITKAFGFNNYDSCKFQGKKSPIQINGENVENTESGRKLIMDLLADAPKIEDFDFKPWDDATTKKVADILASYGSPGRAINTIKTEKEDINVDTELDNIHMSINNDEDAGSEDSEKNDMNEFLADLDL